ncbi:peptidoglycan binding protein CsiV [Vibrio sp. SCSIO 43136]|uniref:peptidoglycan binding protein CsiV n=1 Tax=Vibrio sp. SCSIO 43136 TaxID=2819101 RepID=UPI002075D746|nr:peptidoglycan binding protein CsiV [Vibrio sp. SCSIO 43136]USD66201.1 peptidoglycan binding protein CsiV [Vibrio sp. SCSIO 43136]
MKKLIPILLFLVSFQSFAQRQFDIEVIIFKRSVNPEQTNESWPNTLPEIDMSKAIALRNGVAMERKGAKMLPTSSYELNSEYQALKRHAAFKPMMHVAWRQGDQGRFAAPVFHIQAGKDYSERFDAAGNMRGAEQSVEGLSDEIQEQTIHSPIYELDGKLQVYVQHYLFAELSLDLKAPSVREVSFAEPSLEISEEQTDADVQVGNLTEVTPTLEVEEFLKSYRMEQKRRMRSTETHYLDHPLMGMIIQVRRVPQA